MNFPGWVSNTVYEFAEKYVKRDITSKRISLEHRLVLDGKTRNALMRNELAKLVSFAQQQVPYYRDCLRHFDSSKLKNDLQWMNEIPLLNKEIILEQKTRLISDTHRQQFLHQRKTGGSTGKSVTIQYSQNDLDWTAAVNLSLNVFTKRAAGDLEIHLAAEFGDPINWVNRIYGLVKKIAMNRENLFVSSLDERALSIIYHQLERQKAFVVQGHPSTVYALSCYAEKNKNSKKQLFSLFESTGEVLLSFQAEHIKNHLGAKVFNRYGSAEFGVVAHSHENPMSLEVLEMVAYPESVVHASGQRELLLTGLLNHAMPLIRYQTGDSAKVECHDGIYFLEELEGRVHDVVKVGQTYFATHYIQDVLDRFSSHLEFQLLYRGADRVMTRMLIVPKDFSSSKKEIEKGLERYLQCKVPIEWVSFEKLVKVGWREKFRRAVEDPREQHCES